jgi:hypothetical protein
VAEDQLGVRDGFTLARHDELLLETARAAQQSIAF